MHFPPFSAWPLVRETINGQPIEIRCPPDSPERVQAVIDYWADEVGEQKRVRTHDWGGHVDKAVYEPLGCTLFFKRFTIQSARHQHKPRRARWTVQQEERIQEAGFNTARIVGLAERRRMGVVVESAIIHEAVTDAKPVIYLMNNEKLRASLSLKQRRTLVFGLGKDVGRWHNTGLFHGDMHAGNVFVKILEDSVDTWWLDNEEGKQYRSLPISKRIHDLDHMSRFNYRMPITDRVRFWESYTDECGIAGDEKRQLARKLTRMTQKYLRKKGTL